MVFPPVSNPRYRLRWQKYCPVSAPMGRLLEEAIAKVNDEAWTNQETLSFAGEADLYAATSRGVARGCVSIR